MKNWVDSGCFELGNAFIYVISLRLQLRFCVWLGDCSRRGQFRFVLAFRSLMGSGLWCAASV